MLIMISLLILTKFNKTIDQDVCNESCNNKTTYFSIDCILLFISIMKSVLLYRVGTLL